MSIRTASAVFAVLGAALWMPFALRAQPNAPAAVEAGAPEDPDAAFEPLLRGPVHEAFAEQYNPDPQAGLVVPKEPPPPVEELPPEIKPEGEDVEWIPGYWAWDDERQDFIWTSGLWRQIPPGQRWLPGYWTQSGQGWQWVSGTWVAEDVQELHYLPEPPATLELGQSGEPPSNEHIWVPGIWRYQVDRYVWRPGYWSMGYRDRVWVPARYLWTPRGCVYFGGYWDYALPARGFLYAPVYFHRPIYRTPGYFYSPSIFVSVGLLTDHFWVRPGYRHYYFGDYYGPTYTSWGIYPWFRYTQVHHRAYDPLYSFYRYHHGSRWHEYRHRWSTNYDWYTRHADWRPPRSWSQQTVIQNRIVNIDARQYNRTDITNINNILLGRSVRDIDHVRDRDLRAVRIDQQQRERYRERFEGVRQIADERRRVESERVSDLLRQGGRDPRAPDSRTADWRGSDRGPRGAFRLPDLAGDARRGDRDRGPGPRGESRSREAEQILTDRIGRAGTGPSREPPGRSGPPDAVRDAFRSRGEAGGSPGRPDTSAGQSRPETRLEELRAELRDRLQTDRLPTDAARGPGSSSPAAGAGRPGSPDRPSIDRPGSPDRPSVGRPGGDGAGREGAPGRDGRGRTEGRPNIIEAPGRDGAPGREGTGERRPTVGRPGLADPPGRSGESDSGRSPRLGQPSPAPGQAAPTVPRLGPQADRPASEAGRRPSLLDRLGPQADRPAPQVDRPAPQLNRPSPQVDRAAPRVNRPAPEIRLRPPELSRPAPEINRPAPDVGRSPDVGRPTPSLNRPLPQLNQPAPQLNRGAPEVGRQAPSLNRPLPQLNRGAPDLGRPAPQVSRPAPQLNRPLPQLNRSPAPQINRSPAPQLNRSPAPQINRSPAPQFRGPAASSRPSPSIGRGSSGGFRGGAAGNFNRPSRESSGGGPGRRGR